MSSIRRIVCIDPGLVNFAYLVMDCKSGKIYEHNTLDFGRDNRSDTHRPLMQFLRGRMRQITRENKIEAIVCERQLKHPYIEQVVTIRTWCDLKRVPFCSVNPYSMKTHYKVATGNYAQNKRKVVELVTKKLSTLEDPGVLNPKDLSHHLADAYLLGMFYSERMK